MRKLRALLVAAVVAFWSATAGAQAVVHSGNRILATGDSITASRVWLNTPGGLLDQLDTGLKHISGTAGASFIAGKPGTSFIAGKTRGFSFINTGINGNQTGDLSGNIAGRITQYSPDVVIILIGVNDINGGAGEPAAVTNWTSILSQVHSALPSAQIAVEAVWIFGEQWVAGSPPTWAAGSDNANNLDIAVSGLCAGTANCTYMNLRGQALTFESTTNTPAPGINFPYLSADGVHPTETPTGPPSISGALFMSNAARASFTVVP